MTEPPLHRPRTRPSEADLAQCVRCGLCLQALPHLRRDRPRDRVAARPPLPHRALSEGLIEPTPTSPATWTSASSAATARPSARPASPTAASWSAPAPTSSTQRPRRCPGGCARSSCARSSPSPARLRLLASPCGVYRALGPASARRSACRIAARSRDARADASPASRSRDRGVLATARRRRQSARVAMLTGCIMPLATAACTARPCASSPATAARSSPPPRRAAAARSTPTTATCADARTLARRNIDAFLDAQTSTRSS